MNFQRVYFEAIRGSYSQEVRTTAYGSERRFNATDLLQTNFRIVYRVRGQANLEKIYRLGGVSDTRLRLSSANRNTSLRVSLLRLGQSWCYLYFASAIIGRYQTGESWQFKPINLHGRFFFFFFFIAFLIRCRAIFSLRVATNSHPRFRDRPWGGWYHRPRISWYNSSIRTFSLWSTHRRNISFDYDGLCRDIFVDDFLRLDICEVCFLIDKAERWRDARNISLE